jgi:hypothetical protein
LADSRPPAGNSGGIIDTPDELLVFDIIYSTAHDGINQSSSHQQY